METKEIIIPANNNVDPAIAKLTESALKIDNGKDHLSDNTSNTSGVSVGESNSSSAQGSPYPTRDRTGSVPPSPDEIWQEVKETPDSGNEEEIPKQEKLAKKQKGIGKLFRRHSSTSEESTSHVGKHSKRRLSEDLDLVRVDSLPQLFLAKYLGHRPCEGLSGTGNTRGPVEDMLDTVGKLRTGEDLPLCVLQVSIKGIIVQEHKDNKGRKMHKELIPLEFISYGVQDVQFSRVFTFIVVRELSSKKKKTECHAYICDRSATTRRLALSLALAFKEYANKLKGKPHKFKVELDSEKVDEKSEEDVVDKEIKPELSEV